MNHRSIGTSFKLALGVVVIAMASGCASTQEMTELRTMAQQAQQSAASLANRVQAAEEKADRALAAADQASQTADQAQAAAENAQQCCDDNRERIERMFETLQKK